MIRIACSWYQAFTPVNYMYRTLNFDPKYKHRPYDNFLYGQSKYLIKMKFDQTFTPNARTPMLYINFVLILLGQC